MGNHGRLKVPAGGASTSPICLGRTGAVILRVLGSGRLGPARQCVGTEPRPEVDSVRRCEQANQSPRKDGSRDWDLDPTTCISNAGRPGAGRRASFELPHLCTCVSTYHLGRQLWSAESLKERLESSSSMPLNACQNLVLFPRPAGTIGRILAHVSGPTREGGGHRHYTMPDSVRGRTLFPLHSQSSSRAW